MTSVRRMSAASLFKRHQHCDYLPATRAPGLPAW